MVYKSVTDLIKSYLRIERSILNAIVAQFFAQFINASFLAIQPLYMQHEGYNDGQIAGFLSFRFLGVLILALPIGLYIRKRKIKNLFYISSFAIPVLSLFIILSIDKHYYIALYLLQLAWGAAFTFEQIPILPYILRNAKKESHTMAISLSYATWSFAAISSGWLISVLNYIDPVFFNEKAVLMIISAIGLTGVYFIRKIKIKEHIPPNQESLHINAFDWKTIFKALTPTLIIAVGAGLTIPFMGLFFVNVHHMTTASYAFLNSVAAILVATGAMLVPVIKKEIGYHIAVPVTQSFAVLALVLMATTQFYSEMSIAIYIAMACFLLRQPLMNLAGPMTSEIVINYSGKRNREMVSALTSAIWSGSWFISTRIFKMLRDSGFAYVNVFLITAAIYVIGIIWYYLLIVDYNKKEKAGMIED